MAKSKIFHKHYKSIASADYIGYQLKHFCQYCFLVLVYEFANFLNVENFIEKYFKIVEVIFVKMVKVICQNFLRFGFRVEVLF